MDAVTLINENLNIEQLLEHYQFNDVHSDGEIIRCCCKLHEGSNPTAFAISRETGLWFCHTGCNRGGDHYTLVQIMEHLDFIPAVQWLAEFFHLDISGAQIIERKPTYIKELQTFVKLMKKRKPKDLLPFTLDQELKVVTKYRNFKNETLIFFNLGFVEHVTLTKRNNEKYTLHNRLVFPILFKGIQIGMSLRRTNSSDVPKWSHQPVHIDTGAILYNYDNIGNSQSVVICEGITDVWAYHEVGVTAVATFGAHITELQYKLLLKTGADLVLSFDGDEAGRLATEKAKFMFHNKANLSQVHFDEGEDPESIDREVLLNKYNNRRKA